MEISLSEAKDFIINYTTKLGFDEKDSQFIAQNLIEAEISGKKSHGLVSLLNLKNEVEKGGINTASSLFKYTYITKNILLVNGEGKTGYAVIPQTLDISLKRCKLEKVFCVGIENFGYSSGYIGQYARISAENDLIFIAFNKSPGGLVPYGAKKSLWGTNPLTIGIPYKNTPIILDMASSLISWGEVFLSLILGKKIPLGKAVNSRGRPTDNPSLAVEGGVLPFAEYKGSGLAFIMEILAYTLITSKENYCKQRKWGCFYILIDPGVFLPKIVFQKRIKESIKRLKELPRVKKGSNIFFPGERASFNRFVCLNKGSFRISKRLWQCLNFSLKNFKNPF